MIGITYSRKPYYSFSIEPSRLLKIGYVLHRNEANSSMMPTYQRLIKKKRLNEIRDFIDHGGYFPNSLIVSIDNGGKGDLKFEPASTKGIDTQSKIGTLYLPRKYRSAYIIDGQHRLYGYADSKYKETDVCTVCGSPFPKSRKNNTLCEECQRTKYQRTRDKQRMVANIKKKSERTD